MGILLTGKPKKIICTRCKGTFYANDYYLTIIVQEKGLNFCESCLVDVKQKKKGLSIVEKLFKNEVEHLERQFNLKTSLIRGEKDE